MKHSSEMMVIVWLAALTAIGCGQANSGSPSGPSAQPAGPTWTGATISGQVQSASGPDAPAASTTVTVVGTALIAAIDPSGRFVLNDVPSGSVQLHFSGPGVDATATLLDVKERERIEVVVLVKGSTATLNSLQRTTADNKVELEGRIAAVNPEGMTRTLRVEERLVSVPMAADIRHGSTAVDFSALIVGERVHVRGRMSGLMVLADLVILQNRQSGVPVSLRGSLANLQPPCPAVRFTLEGWTVETTGATDFRKGACQDLSNGKRVHLKGRPQPTGRVLAEWVMFENQ